MLKFSFNKVAPLLNEDSNTGEICEILKNSFFKEHPRLLLPVLSDF